MDKSMISQWVFEQNFHGGCATLLTSSSDQGIAGTSFDPQISHSGSLVIAAEIEPDVVPDVGVVIELDPRQVDLLGRLAETGLFGSTIDEVARDLLLDGLRQAWCDGFIEQRTMDRSA
jgi:hypothetical protein